MPRVETTNSVQMDALQISLPDSSHESASSHVVRQERSSGETCELDLVTIVALTQWVEQAIAMMGRKKLEALVEACQMAGCLPSDYRNIVIRLARPYPDDLQHDEVTSQEYLAIMVHLENLVGGSTQRETALLSVLSDSN